jgi:hypothetical protein
MTKLSTFQISFLIFKYFVTISVSIFDSITKLVQHATYVIIKCNKNLIQKVKEFSDPKQMLAINTFQKIT